MSRHMRPLAIILLLSSLLVASGQTTGTLRCLEPQIAGFESEYNKAVRYIGHGTTSDPQTMKVFVAVKGKELYMQSNYKRPDADNPTKLSSDEDLSPGVSSGLLHYLVNDDPSQSDNYKHAQIVIDQSVFNSHYFEVFNDSDNVEVVDSLGDIHPTAVIRKSTDEPERVIVGDDGIYYLPAAFSQARTLKHLGSRPFDNKSLGVISLVNNTETTQAFQRYIPSSNQIGVMSQAATEEDVLRAVQSKAGSTVLLLGHIEHSSFITYSTDGSSVLLEIPVKTLMETAESSNVTLFLIGCNSATITDTGVVGTFNTVDALMRIRTALGATTVAQFFANLTPDGAHLVLSLSDLTGVGLDVHDSQGDHVGRIVLPRPLWVASSPATITEQIGDVLHAIWNWLLGIVSHVVSWLRGSWLGIVFVVVFLSFGIIKAATSK